MRFFSSSFQKIWLSDQSTYPLIGLLSTALSGAIGFMSYKLYMSKRDIFREHNNFPFPEN